MCGSHRAACPTLVIPTELPVQTPRKMWCLSPCVLTLWCFSAGPPLLVRQFLAKSEMKGNFWYSLASLLPGWKSKAFSVFFLIEANCFQCYVGLCLYNHTNESAISIHMSFPLESPLPTSHPSRLSQSAAEFPVIQQLLTSCVYYIWQCMFQCYSIHATLPPLCAYANLLSMFSQAYSWAANMFICTIF